MNYVVTELQTNNGTTATLTNVFDSFPLAEQKFYQILSFAVVSEVEIHAAFIVDENGFMLKTESYKHPKEEPEVSAEPEE